MKKEELLQSAKQILFNTEMVRAILDGRKTMTRRVIKVDKVNDVINSPARKSNPDIPDEKFIRRLVNRPYEVGDILYVRETFVQPASHIFWYKADDNSWLDGKNMRWKPSIHMPKEAARIFLIVKDVRVERLQEITEEQASKEGAIDNRGFIHSPDNEYTKIHTAKEHFIDIWNSTVKKSDLDTYGWDANPWIWVIEIERIEVKSSIAI